MSDDHPLRVGSLFSGYLGLDQGIAAAFADLFGIETRLAWASDIEPGPCKVIAYRYPDVPNLGDITTIDWHTVPEVDLIGGGSPCQDISQAGRMAGMVTGTRSNLWTVMRDAIATLRPMFVVWENVGSALSTKAASASLPDHLDRAIDHHLAVAQETHHAPTATRHTRAAHRLMESRTRRVGVPYPKPALRALGRVLGDLASLGYDAVWHSNRAADIGAPHARRRVFLVAANPRGQAWLQRARLRPSGPGRVGRGRPHHDGGETRPVAASLLPTTRDWKGHNQRRDTTCLTGALLPTPRATDGTKGGPNQRGSSGDLMLPSAVCQLLPTPTATQPGGTAANHLRKKPGRQQVTDLGMIVEQGLLETGGRLLPTCLTGALLPTPRATRGGSSTGTVQLLTERDSNAQGGPGEVLRDMRGTDGTEAVRRSAGGPDSLPEPQDLLAELWEQADGCEPCGTSVPSSPAPGYIVCDMRDDRGSARPSHRPELGERRSLKSSDAVRELPSETSLEGRPGAEVGRCGEGRGYGCSSWYQYAQAVHRWEVRLGRIAPAPTKHGQKGQPRLNPVAVEWMMGASPGWFTDVPGITDNEALKLAGNGVVPQQAAAAIVYCLHTFVRKQRSAA